MSTRSLALFALLLASCGGSDDDGIRPQGSLPDTTSARTDTSGACTAICDASPPSIPVISDTGGMGDVTTYGGVGNTVPSAGGACNYGATGITHYAAIQVNRLPGDGEGQWESGRICGQCVEVRARSPEGWRTTHARIVDKCPDGHCGIDLGGAPATDLMSAQAGRYSGSWRFIPCDSLPGVSDGPTSLWVKEGSSVWWSVVQVRNPPSAVQGISLLPAGGTWTPLTWATEAENFLKVPPTVFTDSDATVRIAITYRMSPPDTFETRAANLAHAKATLLVP
jgi:expansin (peptidoglycan-binding protein)